MNTVQEVRYPLSLKEASDLAAKGILVWYTLDSKFLTLNLIDDSHLLNIENFLRGNGKQKTGYVIGSPKWWHVYRIIVREINRRGLSNPRRIGLPK